MTAHVASVNISERSGTPKTPVPEIVLDDEGIVRDSHRGPGHRQVSLLGKEDIEAFAAGHGRPIAPGEFAENITTTGLDYAGIRMLDVLTIGEAVLEVSQIGKVCHGDSCAIFREMGTCIMPERGVFCRVRKGGRVEPGDPVACEPSFLTFRIITLSNRASRGVYEDASGPEIEKCLDEFFAARPWRLKTARQIIPDDADAFEQLLVGARDEKVDVVISTGSTGVGPSDIAPDVVGALADRTIPGIMEAIRVKFGETNPKALLSRSIAAVMGQTLVYCLPGSPRAVREYMGEVLKTMEHIFFMRREWDVHG